MSGSVLPVYGLLMLFLVLGVRTMRAYGSTSYHHGTLNTGFWMEGLIVPIRNNIDCYDAYKNRRVTNILIKYFFLK